MTRDSTPKWQVVHREGAVAISGISRTEATAIARRMGTAFRIRPEPRQIVPLALRSIGLYSD